MFWRKGPGSLMSGSLGFVSGVDTVVVTIIIIIIIISLYSDAVFKRNADYTVIDWLGSTVG